MVTKQASIKRVEEEVQKPKVPAPTFESAIKMPDQIVIEAPSALNLESSEHFDEEFQEADEFKHMDDLNDGGLDYPHHHIDSKAEYGLSHNMCANDAPSGVMADDHFGRFGEESMDDFEDKTPNEYNMQADMFSNDLLNDDQNHGFHIGADLD